MQPKIVLFNGHKNNFPTKNVLLLQLQKFDGKPSVTNNFKLLV